MSVQAMSAAFAVQGVEPAEKLVLLSLANFADQRSRCWPSQKQLAADTCLSVRTIIRVLKALDERDLISREERFRTDGSRTTDLITLRLAPPAIPDGEPDTVSDPHDFDGDGDDTVSGLTTFEPPVNHQGSSPPSEAHRTRETASDFECFWAAWPEKKDRGAARRAYATARKKASAEVILAGVPNVTETHAWRSGHHVHCSTWLNGERWADVPDLYERAMPITGGMVSAASDELGFRMALEKLNGQSNGNSVGDQSLGRALSAPEAFPGGTGEMVRGLRN